MRDDEDTRNGAGQQKASIGITGGRRTTGPRQSPGFRMTPDGGGGGGV